MPSLAGMISHACFPVMTAALLTGAAVEPARAQSSNTTFFVTSTGIGNGANLGGLAGADNHCQTLAQAAGAGAAPEPGVPICRPRKPTAKLP